MDNSVENMISGYVENNLDKCLNEFEGLTNYEISAEDEKEVITTITEQDVVIDLLYVLDVKGLESEGEIDRFRTHIPLNFRRIYKMAFNITQAQQQINFLDYHAITLIDLFSGIDGDKLPPLTGTSFEKGAQTYWFKGEVEDRVTEMLTSYIPAMQVLGSKNYDASKYEPIEDPMVKGIYRNMVVPLSESYRTIDSDMTYLPIWLIYLDITPNEGGIISPQTFFNFFPIGLQRYNFAYDISYPVMITLTDTSAFYGDGYTLMFALESNIRNNDVINTSEVQLGMTDIQGESSMVCNINQRTSGDITVNIIDGLTGEPVEGAAITFSVGSEGCMIGSTDAEGTFTGKFPRGMGALQVSMNEYQTKSLFYGTSKKDDSVDVVLEPFRYKNIKVMKRTIEKLGRNNWVYEGSLKELDENEQTILLLERVKEDIYDSEYSSPVNVGLDGGEIRLVPGEYKLNGQVMLNELMIIPASERKICITKIPLIGCVDHDEYTIPEQQLDQSVSGGVEFDEINPNKNWVVTKQDLDNSEEIIIYVLSFSLKDLAQGAREIEDLNQMGKVFEITSENRIELEPEFN